jgi:predicted metal-dependent phosphoesterase TrpH
VGTADLHIHTRHGDGMATVPEILAYVDAQRLLDVIAVCEHDTLRPAEEARELHARGSYGFEVVSGMEVTTLDGHLLAVYIDDPVPSFRRMEETLVEVHRRGGLAIIAHPLSWLTRSASRRVIERVMAVQNDGVWFDGIEEVNMSPAGRQSRQRVRRLNEELRLAAIGSSDAHFLQAIGTAYTRFAGNSAGALRAAIEAKATEAVAGVAPGLRELGYRNIAVQSWRGMMATPRAMGWAPTIRSFIISRRRRRPGATGGAR